jgi:hypothetical protein
MTIKWFGEPWPSAEERAPVCETDEDKIPTPAGKACVGCDREIVDEDQGIVMAASAGIPAAWVLKEGSSFTIVCAQHLECFLLDILGPGYAKQIKG